ncbi:hypothetical protein OKW24_000472 [Peribacillus simplex]|nr:hypothetical protein [Peribacillus simplex]
MATISLRTLRVCHTPSHPRRLQGVRILAGLLAHGHRQRHLPISHTVVHSRQLPNTVAGPRWHFTSFPFKSLRHQIVHMYIIFTAFIIHHVRIDYYMIFLNKFEMHRPFSMI